MELAILVWLATIIPNVHSVMSLMSFVTFSASFVSVVGYFIYSLNYNDWDYDVVDGKAVLKPKVQAVADCFKTAIKFSVPSLILFGTLNIATPDSEKSVYLMAGAYAAQQVATSEVGKDVEKIVQLKVKNYLADLEEESVKKGKK